MEVIFVTFISSSLWKCPFGSLVLKENAEEEACLADFANNGQTLLTWGRKKNKLNFTLHNAFCRSLATVGLIRKVLHEPWPWAVTNLHQDLLLGTHQTTSWPPLEPKKSEGNSLMWERDFNNRCNERSRAQPAILSVFSVLQWELSCYPMCVKPSSWPGRHPGGSSLPPLHESRREEELENDMANLQSSLNIFY